MIPKPKKKKMDTSFLVLCLIAVLLIVLAYWMKGWDLPVSGLTRGAQMLLSIGPNLLLGFALAGLIQVLVPTDYIAKIIGEGSGFKGLIIATAAGALAPGGPYVNVPLVAVLYESGAGVGPLAAFLSAWGIIPITRTLVYEIPLLGTHFAFARYGASIIFPLIIGAITSLLFKLGKG
jgi:uncharacterized protein